MLFYFTARIVSSATAFLYPGYASYKTLSQRPASEEELERWLMYWSVLGCIVGIEYLAEWLVSWIPFYYPLKTLFLLYLVLPQTKGASYIYTTHLYPFFRAHEAQIDSTLTQLRAKAYTFVQERLRALWASVQGQPQQPNANAEDQNRGTTGMAPAQIVGTLWRTYGPGILASGAALLRSSAPTAPSTSTTNAHLRTPPPSSAAENQTLLDRRRRLEAELAALETVIPSTQGSTGIARPGSGLGIRERTNSGRFEEIEVPSDVEGYDVGGDGDGEGQGQGHGRAQGARVQGVASWFGWGGAVRGGYERVHSE